MKHTLLAVAAFVGLGVAPAFSQVAEIGLQFGTSLLTNNVLGAVSASTLNDTPVKLTDGFRFGFRLTFNTQRYFGHEIGYAYSRTHLRFETTPPQEGGMAIHEGFYDFLVYGLPEGTRIRPFVAGGAEFANFNPPGTSAGSGGGQTKWGLNYGGGIKARVSSMFGIRVDFRQYAIPKPFDLGGKGWLRQNEISAGFSLFL